MTEVLHRARALVVAAVLTAPLSLAACSDNGSSDQSGAGNDAASHSSVEFRRVVSSTSTQAQCSAAPESPSEKACEALAQLACPTEAQALDDFLLACGTGPYRDEGFLLAKAEITQGIESAEAGKPEDHGWVIDLTLSADATQAFANLTADLAGTGRQVALVVDGKVISAPAPATEIDDGRLRLDLGDMSQQTASDLAQRLAS